MTAELALCAECGAEYKQTAQAHPTPKRKQSLGICRDTKGLPQPKQLDCGFQLSVPLNCGVGFCSCICGDGGGTDTLEFLVFRVFL